MKKHSIGKVLLLEAAAILVVLVFILVVTAGEGWWIALCHYFIDLPTIASIFLFALPILFVNGVVEDFRNAFLIGKKPFTIAQMKRSLEAVKMAQQLVLCGCFFITVITFIILLYNMEDLNALGPCLSVMSLTVLYMAILEAFLIPLKAHVQNQITDMMDVINEEE